MRRSQGPPGSNRIFVCSGSDELLIQAVARFRSTCNQAEATASIWLLRNVSLPILSAHTAAVCGSVAAIFFENAVTATSRDSLCGSVPRHAPAAYASDCDQRLINDSTACCRFFPSAKLIAHSLAACGSLPAHCQTIDAAAAGCALLDKRDTSRAASDGSDSATIPIMPGMIVSRTVASLKF